MTNYSDKVFYLSDYFLFLKGVQLTKIENKFSRFNLFYKYLTQKYEILISEEKILLKF